MNKNKKRCFGNGEGKEFYADYHDKEWGVPIHDDQHLFEMLCLEGAQAGLSWEIILKKRDGYRRLFHYFQIEIVSEMTDDELEVILKNPSIVRNRRKVFSVRENAKAFLRIKKEFGSFDTYIWKFVNYKPMLNRWVEIKEVPSHSEISDKISIDLKKRGVTFVGTKIIYAFMQAIGMVNDHLLDCSFR